MKRLGFYEYVVAWIDLLGQSEKLSEFTKIPESDEEYQEFLAKAKATFERVLAFRKIVQECCRTYARPIEVSENQKISWTGPQLRLVERYSNPRVGIQFISDAAMLKVCLRRGRKYSVVLSVNIMLDVLAWLMLNSLTAGVPLRGAVDVGICADLGWNDLYGQAVSRAHGLESKCAGYPRIVVGRSFMDYVDSAEAEGKTREERRIIAQHVELIRRGLAKDVDGAIIVSYLSRRFVSRHADDSPFVERCVSEACSFIQREIERYHKIGNAKLRSRYEALMNYFKSQDCWVESVHHG